MKTIVRFLLKAHRWVAALALVVSLALLWLALPLLAAAVASLKGGLAELNVVGTGIYQADRSLRIERGASGVLVYGFGMLATLGFWGMAWGCVRSLFLRISIWALAVIAACGAIKLVGDRVVEGTDVAFKVIYMGIPGLIICLAVLAIALLLVERCRASSTSAESL